MKRHFREWGPCYVVCFLVLTVMVVLGSRELEVHTYMDVENNVVCYYTVQSMQCFTYTDEGSHLSLNR